MIGFYSVVKNPTDAWEATTNVFRDKEVFSMSASRRHEDKSEKVSTVKAFTIDIIQKNKPAVDESTITAIEDAIKRSSYQGLYPSNIDNSSYYTIEGVDINTQIYYSKKALTPSITILDQETSNTKKYINDILFISIPLYRGEILSITRNGYMISHVISKGIANFMISLSTAADTENDEVFKIQVLNHSKDGDQSSITTYAFTRTSNTTYDATVSVVVADMDITPMHGVYDFRPAKPTNLIFVKAGAKKDLLALKNTRTGKSIINPKAHIIIEYNDISELSNVAQEYIKSGYKAASYYETNNDVILKDDNIYNAFKSLFKYVNVVTDTKILRR